jgi:hypothetical protein
MRLRRPISLYDSIGLPNPDDEPESPARLNGFVQVTKLYKLFDNKFFGPWNTRSREDIPHGWLEGLQMHLSGVVPGYIEGADISLVDIKFSLQWLRTLIWQLLMQNSTPQLSMNNPHPYKYIVDIGHEVIDAYGNFPREPMEIHGIDLVRHAQSMTLGTDQFTGRKDLRRGVRTGQCHPPTGAILAGLRGSRMPTAARSHPGIIYELATSPPGPDE